MTGGSCTDCSSSFTTSAALSLPTLGTPLASAQIPTAQSNEAMAFILIEPSRFAAICAKTSALFIHPELAAHFVPHPAAIARSL